MVATAGAGAHYHHTAVEPRDAAEHPTMYKTVPHNKNVPSPSSQEYQLRLKNQRRLAWWLRKGSTLRLGPGGRAVNIKPKSHQRTKKVQELEAPGPLKAKGRMPIKIRVIRS